MNSNAGNAVPIKEPPQTSQDAEKNEFSFEAATGMMQLLKQIEHFVELLTTDADLIEAKNHDSFCRPLIYTKDLLRMARNQLAVEISLRTPLVNPNDDKNITSAEATIYQSRIYKSHQLMMVKMEMTNMMQTIDSHLGNRREVEIPALTVDDSCVRVAPADVVDICRFVAEPSDDTIFRAMTGDDMSRTYRRAEWIARRSDRALRTPSLVKERVRQFEVVNTHSLLAGEDGDEEVAMGEDEAGKKTRKTRFEAFRKHQEADRMRETAGRMTLEAATMRVETSEEQHEAEQKKQEAQRMREEAEKLRLAAIMERVVGEQMRVAAVKERVEAEKKSEEVRKKNEEAEKKSEEARKKNEEAEKKSEEARKKNEEAEKKKDEAIKKKEEAEKKKEEEAAKKKEEAEKKKEEEAAKKKEVAEKNKEEAAKKKEEAEKKKDEALKKKEEAEKKKQEAAKKELAEKDREEAEKKKEDAQKKKEQAEKKREEAEPKVNGDKKIKANKKKEKAELAMDVIDLTSSSTTFCSPAFSSPLESKMIQESGSKKCGSKRTKRRRASRSTSKQAAKCSLAVDDTLPKCALLECGPTGCGSETCGKTTCTLTTCTITTSTPTTCESMSCSSHKCGSNKCESHQCESPQCDLPHCDSHECDSHKCGSHTCDPQTCDSSKCDSHVCDSSKCDSHVCDSSKCDSHVCDSSKCDSHNCGSLKCESPMRGSRSHPASSGYITANDNSEHCSTTEADVVVHVSELIVPDLILQRQLTKSDVVAHYELMSDAGREAPLEAAFNYKCSVLDFEVEAEGRSQRIAKQEAAIAMLVLIVDLQTKNSLPPTIKPFTQTVLNQIAPILIAGLRLNVLNNLRKECHKSGLKMPTFKTLSTTGPQGEHIVTVQCTALDLTAVASGHNKRKARREAATSILRQFKLRHAHE